MATSALRACNRKMTQTSATMALSSNKVRFKVSMARLIRAERSYTASTLTPFGQARRDLGEPILHMLDDRKRILAEPLQRDAGDDLALAVQLGDATPLIRGELHAGDVLEQHRNASCPI